MKTEWQHYKSLELIPDTVPEPRSHKLAMILPLSLGWRLLINALVREHLSENRTEYLERCWNMSDLKVLISPKVDSLHQFFELMN